MKVLETKTRTNGYGCSCCRRSKASFEWIDESSMIPEEELRAIALISSPWDCNCNDEGCDNCKWGNLSRFTYENDGKILYGFFHVYGAANYTTYFIDSSGMTTRLER